jgi:signal transduction histidine kinase
MSRLVGPVSLPDDRWSATVAGLGLAAILGYVWNLLRELSTLAVVVPPLVVFALGVVLSGGLVYAGARLAAADVDASCRRTVATWAVAGGGLWLGITLISVVIRRLEGRTVAELPLVLLLNFDAGAIAGVVAGASVVAARRERDRARRTRDTLTFLNRTLRHELLNGVQLIHGYAELLADDEDPAPDERADAVVDTSEELIDLIDDVRQVADVHAGTVDPGPVDLAAVVEETVDWAREAYPAAEFDVETDEAATALATDAVEHAVRNLVANAVDHSDRETPTVEITVEADAVETRVRVADDGPGFPDGEDVLEPSDGETHGFGLYLSKTLAEGYGGSLTLENDDPRGAVATITLPAVTRSETPRARATT